MRDQGAVTPSPRGTAAERFADQLRTLRAGVGNPSFRAMAGRSGGISHTTLHEAAAGTRFPSWETTREFVRVCEADEVQWRRWWEEAQLAPPGAVEAPELMSTAPLALQPEDSSRFIDDITIPDRSRVKVNTRFIKVWAFQNVGQVGWHNRFLAPIHPVGDDGGCRVPERVPIGDTSPGEQVMVSLQVTAPSRPRWCWVGWKMVDEFGKPYFPSRRPVYFLIDVTV